MRDLVAAHSSPAPQAPARNPPQPSHRHPSTASLETFNSHRRIKRLSLGDKRVYRPSRRAPLSRIDEAPALCQAAASSPRPLSSAGRPRPRPRSPQRSADFSSTRAALRSRSNASADTGRSVPVCNQSQDLFNPVEYSSMHYEPKGYDSSEDLPASMTDLPIMVPLDPVTGSYIPYPEYAYYDSCRPGRIEWKCKRKSKNNNLFLAFMY